jgi:tetratricopeptide (TPR) repeat protein
MRTGSLLPISAVLPVALAGLLPGCFPGPQVHPRGLEQVRRGYAHLSDGDLERAEIAFAHALEFHEELPEALNGAGIVERQRGRLAAARRRFEQAVHVAPDFAEALVNLGELELAEGRPDLAEARFRAALKVDPDLLPARLDLARALLHRGRVDAARREALWAAARREYLHLLEARPGDADAHHDLAYMDYESRRYARAAESFAAALRSAPDRPDALHGACISLARLGRCDDALRACERCLVVAPATTACERSAAGARACAAPGRP